MLSPFKRFKPAIRLFSKLHFYIETPKKYDAVIFYTERDFLIREYVLDPIGFSSVSIDPMKVNIHYLVLYKLFLLIVRNLKTLIDRRLHCLFTEAHLLSFRPKTVITLIDDCGIFSELSRYCKDTEFYAIQNGTRSFLQLQRENEKIFLTNFFCFGQHVVDTYKTYNKTIVNPILSGSFIADIYYYNHLKNRRKEKFDICLIDHWVSHDFNALYGNESEHCDIEYLKSLKILDQHLKKYVTDHDLSFAIAARGNLGRQYYFDLFGESVYQKKNGQFSTYETMFNSSLIVGVVSTTLSEALGWGKKVLFFDLTGDGRYSSTVFEGIWSLKTDDYSSFKHRIDKLLSMSKGQYKKEFLSYANYRMRGAQDDRKEPSYKMMQLEIMSKVSK